jgi:hypothetical protein
LTGLTKVREDDGNQQNGFESFAKDNNERVKHVNNLGEITGPASVIAAPSTTLAVSIA